MLSLSTSSSLRLMSGANLPPIVAWNKPVTSGLNFSKSNLSPDLVSSLVFYRRTRKVFKSWSLPMSAPGKLLVLWTVTPH